MWGTYQQLVRLWHRNAATVGRSITWGDQYGLLQCMINNGWLRFWTVLHPWNTDILLLTGSTLYLPPSPRQVAGSFSFRVQFLQSKTVKESDSWFYCLWFCFCCFQELTDVPLFLSLHNLCATLKCISPSAAMFRSAVINAQYRISGTHVNPLGMKTDAPMEVIWDIMRCWV